MTENKKNVGIIILAAGASVRFGQPKQLLRFNGKSLIRRAAFTAIQTDCRPAIIVLGLKHEIIQSEIEDLDCEIALNDEWQTGMSSSLKKGLTKLLEISPRISAAVFMLCDQPFIRSEHYKKITEKFYETKKPIIASFYDETHGVPALFARELFPVLMKLEGDEGARKIIENNPDLVENISLPEAALDIDTKADFEKLKHYQQ